MSRPLGRDERATDYTGAAATSNAEGGLTSPPDRPTSLHQMFGAPVPHLQGRQEGSLPGASYLYEEATNAMGSQQTTATQDFVPRRERRRVDHLRYGEVERLSGVALYTAAPISETISRDNVAGDCVRRGALLAYLGQKTSNRAIQPDQATLWNLDNMQLDPVTTSHEEFLELPFPPRNTHGTMRSTSREPHPEPGSSRLNQVDEEQLRAMGFGKHEIDAAMRAAFYDPDRAFEYMLNGIPESRQSVIPPSIHRVSSYVDPNRPIRGPFNPVHHPPPAKDFQSPGSSILRNWRISADTAVFSDVINLFRKDPQLQEVRLVVQQQPHMLVPMLQQLQPSEPLLAEIIGAHLDIFLEVLGEDAESPLPRSSQAISVTEEEREAIERLCRRGFDRDATIHSTRSSASRDESSYRQSATTRATTSESGDDDITRINRTKGGEVSIGRSLGRKRPRHSQVSNGQSRAATNTNCDENEELAADFLSDQPERWDSESEEGSPLNAVGPSTQASGISRTYSSAYSSDSSEDSEPDPRSSPLRLMYMPYDAESRTTPAFSQLGKLLGHRDATGER